MSLPLAYWCHIDVTGPDSPALRPHTQLTATPQEAVEWVRSRVRDAGPQLDREAFGVMWAWLGDHSRRDAAIGTLRLGTPYTYSLTVGRTQWSCSVH